MDKIAVMGDYDSIYGFGALGMELFPTDAGDVDAAEVLKQLAETGYGIIYITEACAGDLREEMETYREKLAPAIIPIPGISGDTGEGVKAVKRSVEQAVGSDILFSQN